MTDLLAALSETELQNLIATMSDYATQRQTRAAQEQALAEVQTQITHRRSVRSTLVLLRSQVEAAQKANVPLPGLPVAPAPKSDKAAKAELDKARKEAQAIIEQAKQEAERLVAEAHPTKPKPASTRRAVTTKPAITPTPGPSPELDLEIPEAETDLLQAPEPPPDPELEPVEGEDGAEIAV